MPGREAAATATVAMPGKWSSSHRWLHVGEVRGQPGRRGGSCCTTPGREATAAAAATRPGRGGGVAAAFGSTSGRGGGRSRCNHAGDGSSRRHAGEEE
uniref:Expressed protein n=2 Tax=Oryza sativa subsp. japonica TaxID=39947 RepID=Q53JZ4_ORYSJ|nr:expressed protein [Oryza sativa Japonica Group]ABA95447.1 expressed protein [Oryza sativa Japonica Group]